MSMPKNMTIDPAPYRGRFAPSPTGPLHFGSLVAAVGSYLDARARGGEWLMRMEDLDPPREMAGAADLILRTLEGFGFEWDGPVLYQSSRTAAYREALDALQHSGLVYGCACTRSEIQRQGRMTPAGPIYSGTCRNGPPKGRKARALRVRSEGPAIQFEDRLLGSLRQDLAEEVGDFVVRRADGLTAYQLAVVVDDAAQGITDVVRGSDLLDSTARQIHLQRLLELSRPRYLHLPIATDPRGEKLSKQTFAPPVESHEGAVVLEQVLRFLNQAVPTDFDQGRLDDCWAWAIAHWDSARIPAKKDLPAPLGRFAP